MFKKWIDRTFGESHVETVTHTEKNGNRVVTVKHYKGKTCIYKSVTTYYPGLSINL